VAPAFPKDRSASRGRPEDALPFELERTRGAIAELPDHLRPMCLFKVNTGTREAEVCGLLWEWEIKVPQLETSVFIIPGHKVKNREDRLVVLNSIARRVIEEQRGQHPTHVFCYERRSVGSMYTAAFRKARKRANLEQVRTHDLKHTVGRRLRAAGVSLEDRQDLLGHKSGKITTHYSAPELISLIQASERVCAYEKHKSDTIVILRKRISVVGSS
jgi:integrase